MKLQPDPVNLMIVMYVIEYECLTAAGSGPKALMNALSEAKVCSKAATKDDWKNPVTPGGLVALIPGDIKMAEHSRENISLSLTELWKSLYQRLPDETVENLKKSKIGLIFSSTKGCIEDFISKQNETEVRAHIDPFFEIINSFEKSNPDLNLSHTTTISNACSSSHVAAEYIQDLFNMGRIDYAILLAADVVGPFIYNGFNSLKVLSHTKNLPFSPLRDGLQLGEALTVLLFSRFSENSEIQIKKAASDTEGSSITRPSVNGAGLVRTLKILADHAKDLAPDLVVAHGTGTKFNDLAEDQALEEFLNLIGTPDIPITNTKWCIGHTLGASGAIDLIATCEMLKSQKVFSIASHSEKDPKLKMNYLLGNQSKQIPIRQALITSLGFGSVHASLLVERLSK